MIGKRAFKVEVILFLSLALAACAPVAMPAPSETPVLPTNTPLLEFTSFPATVMPTQPFLPAMITPDAIQVARWEEYETALAKNYFLRVSFLVSSCANGRFWDNLTRKYTYGQNA